MISAPETQFPEEIDVFVTPHKRMKALVDIYIDQLLHTNFRNDLELKSFLKNLDSTFSEFKLHEQIENEFIMTKLKSRLSELSIHNAVTSDCHHDLQLINLIQLVHQGYSKIKWSEKELNSYESILQSHLRDFTHKFIPHMREEEEVFQPLLMKYFNYEELKNLKNLVIAEHKIGTKLDSQSDCAEDVSTPFQDVDSNFCANVKEVNDAPINQLPDELLLAVFRYLDTSDLYRCVHVCEKWSRIGCDQNVVWFSIAPLHWLSDTNKQPRKRDGAIGPSRIWSHSSEESNVADEWCLARFTQSYLPKIGQSISVINFCYTDTLSTNQINQILQKCPNVISLNLCNTNIFDHVFNKCNFGSLTYLSLAYCSNLTDKAMELLSMAIWFSKDDKINKINEAAANAVNRDFEKYVNCNRCAADDLSVIRPYPPVWLEEKGRPFKTSSHRSKLQQLSINGCKNLTDKAILTLVQNEITVNVKKLDLSGCLKITGLSLFLMFDKMPCLEPRFLSYCNNIDGPFSDDANGCENRDYFFGPCCSHHRWYAR